MAADNFLWRIAGWIASQTFVKVTGDVRLELFRHLTGHAPGFFANRLPGMLTSRITATSNAAFQIESMLMWNVLPPCIATIAAIGFLAAVSIPMAAVLVVAAAVIVVVAMFHFAAAGRPLHHDFAKKAARRSTARWSMWSEICRSSGRSAGRLASIRASDATIAHEMTARQRSLRYLEILRLSHALVVVLMTLALVAWAIELWRQQRATAGDVVLVCTLGLSRC